MRRRNASPPTTVNCTVRKYLTLREIEKLRDYARKHSRYGHRDSTMVLVTYRHGLRASIVMDCEPQKSAISNGTRPSSTRAACTSAGPRTARHPSILSGAMRFVPYASSAVKARPRLTSSSRSAADQEHHRLPPSHPEARQGRQDAFPAASSHAAACVRL